MSVDMSRDAEILKRNEEGMYAPKVYSVRVRLTGDQERIESQAAMLGFKDPAVFMLRCTLLVTRRLEDWRELVQDS